MGLGDYIMDKTPAGLIRLISGVRSYFSPPAISGQVIPSVMMKFWQPIPNVKGVFRTTDAYRPFKVAINTGNNGMIIVGFFSDLEAAARAYDRAARATYKHPLLNYPKAGELSCKTPELLNLKHKNVSPP